MKAMQNTVYSCKDKKIKVYLKKLNKKKMSQVKANHS